MTAPALVVAHPGHELRLHAWMERHRPRLFILTTGSRHGESVSRITASRALIESVGGEAGSVFGAFVDRDLYAHVMAGNAAPFHAVVDRLRDAFVAQPPPLVVADGWQFYNVAHDLVSLIAQVAVAEAGRRLGRGIEFLTYPVLPAEMAKAAPQGPERHRIALSDAMLDRKVTTLRAYPDIAGDIEEMVEALGRGWMAIETLHEPPALDRLAPPRGVVPEYERYGEARAKTGIYREVLRWSHVIPIFESLKARAEKAIAVAEPAGVSR